MAFDMQRLLKQGLHLLSRAPDHLLKLIMAVQHCLEDSAYAMDMNIKPPRGGGEGGGGGGGGWVSVDPACKKTWASAGLLHLSRQCTQVGFNVWARNARENLAVEILQMHDSCYSWGF